MYVFNYFFWPYVFFYIMFIVFTIKKKEKIRQRREISKGLTWSCELWVLLAERTGGYEAAVELVGVYTWNLTCTVILLISVSLNMPRLSCSPERKLDSESLGEGRTELYLWRNLFFLNVCDIRSLRDISYSPYPPSRFLPLSLFLLC